eukprot:TRINITY_DN11247_c1_g1_i3.p1 TRINITY_DN11247_c1_g1~~TRINITY_DN11247_c1_g1_i3.p1  ORF type:complete len:562 (+),score=165.60 TRINITY_DN11247_c1_g1_i3:111-1796(+)
MASRTVLSSDEDSDDEPLAQQVKGKPAQIDDDGVETSEVAESAPKKAKRTVEESEDESDGEFTWKYNPDDMMGDADDRAYLNSLSEVVREQILMERSEEYERAQEKWQMRQRLKRKKKQAIVDDDLGRGAKRAISQAKRQRNKGMEQLRRNRSRKRQQELSEEEYNVAMMDDDEEEEEEGEAYGGYDFDEDEDMDKRRRETEVAEPEEQEDLTEASAEELQTIKISRQKLEVWAHEPFLEKTVTGCLVRVNIGNDGSAQVYRLGLVTGLSTRRVYTLGSTKTDKYLVVKHGLAAKPFRMSYVSNAKFTDSEYTRWHRELLKADDAVLTRSHVLRKRADFEAALRYERSAADVQQIVASRKKANAAPTNFAMEKEKIQAQIKEAELVNDTAKIAELEEQLDRLQTKKATLEASRYRHHTTIVGVNERNRKANRAQISFDEERRKREAEEMKSNLSLRRRTQPSLLKSKPKKDDNADSQPDGEDNADKPNSGAASGKASKLPSRRASEDVSDLHSFDVDLGALPSLGELDAEPEAVSAPKASIPKRKGRGLDLSAYKKKMGLI